MKSQKKAKKKILAFGADGKARFAFSDGKSVKISRDFGTLSDVDNFQQYERAIRKAIKTKKPHILVCDMHPEYNSTKLTKSLSLRASRRRAKQSQHGIASSAPSAPPRNDGLKLVQHHHAHIVSCMVDNGISGKVIGVAFDGTGYGTDENIWGGEFLRATRKRFERAGHLDYVPMPGGEMAVREPWRMAVSYLYKYYGMEFLKLKIPFIKSIDKKKALVLKDMIDKKINSPLTSSMGRLFDAAGALINLTNSVKREAEAAIKLERLADKAREESSYYKGPIIKGIVKDLRQGKDRGLIAVRFHNSVAGYIYTTAKKLSRRHRIKKVVLSGGVFQNKILLEKTKMLFRDSDMNLYVHKKVSAADAGISLGQISIAD